MPDGQNHFYVTLFNSASQDLFPDNTLGMFRIELAQTIYLGPKDRWEVGLCEFTCPPKNVGTMKAIEVVGNTNALIYCNPITPQFVRKNYIRCLRTVQNYTANTAGKIFIIYLSKNRIKHYDTNTEFER